MVLKTVAILGLVATGLAAFGGERVTLVPVLDRPPSFDLVAAMGASLVPVLFAYGGWQTSGFVMGELRRPERDMPRALLLGVAGVVVLYLSVNLVCLRALGADGLAQSRAPASDVMRLALGERGARLIALGIVISTLGFLAQGILTAPRVYYAMARDGLFFRAVGELHPKSRVPVVAIALQGLVAAVIAVSGRYEQILNYVVSVDFISFGLTGCALFVYRRRGERGAYKAPGHPLDDGLLRALVLGGRGRDDPPLSRRQRDRPPDPGRGPAGLRPLVRAEQGVSSPYSAYMEWAKTRSSARFNLASSGLAAYPLAELGAGPDVLELGDSFYGYRRSWSAWRARPGSIPTGSSTRPGRRWPTCSCSPRPPSPATRC
jgi:hypothetical protein